MPRNCNKKPSGTNKLMNQKCREIVRRKRLGQPPPHVGRITHVDEMVKSEMH